MKYLPIFCVGLILSACGPAAKLRHAQRLIDKAIIDGAIVKDEVVKHDTTVIIREKVDTIFQVRHAVDTFRVDGLKIVLQHDTIHKTERIQVLGDRVTRTIHVPYYINRTINAPKTNKVAPGWRTASLITGFLLLVILVVIIYKIIK